MAFNLLFEDAFNEMNGNLDTVSPGNWVAGNVNLPAVILSQVCTVTSGKTTFQPEWVAAITPGADQWAAVTLTNWNIVPLGVGGRIFLRATTFGGGSSTGYEFNFTSRGGGTGEVNVSIFEFTTAHTLYSASIIAAAGDTFLCACQGTTISLYHNGTLLASVTDSTNTSGSISLSGLVSSAQTDLGLTNFQTGDFSTYSISGNVGIAGATVSWSGASSGSTTADGSGNYSITGLVNGGYTITPSLGGYIFSPTSRSEIISNANLTNVNFTAIASGGQTAALSPSYGPKAVQIFGQISSGLNSGEIAGVAVDTSGNLCISGSSSGSINSIDVLGSIADAVPVLIMGNVSGATVPGSTALVACAVDNFGNLLCSIGTGGGSPNTTIDVPGNTGVTPLQVFGRVPSTGLLVGVPCSNTGALGNNIDPISGISPNTLDVADNGTLVPVVLCGRIAAGYPNAGQIVMVSLDQFGCLCVSGSSGSSTTPSAVLSIANGQCVPVQLYQRDSNDQLTSIALTGTGSLLLN